MSKQRLVDPMSFVSNANVSKPDTQEIPDPMSFVETVQKKSPIEKKNVTALSGQEDSGGLFSDIADYFSKAQPIHSGLGTALFAQELTKKQGIYDRDPDEMTAEEKLAYQKGLKQRAAIDDIVTSNLLSSNITTRGYSFIADKMGTLPMVESLISGGIGTVGATALNILGGAADFMQNIGSRAKGLINKEDQANVKVASSEGVAGALYEQAQTLQNVSNSFMRQAKTDYGIANADVDKTFTELLQEGKVGDAFINLGLSSLQQMPQIVALGLTGGSAGAVFAGAGLMGTGASLGEEYAKDGEISGKDALVSIGKGIVEGLTETIFRTDVNAFNSLRKIISTEGKEATKEALIRGYGGIVKKAFAGANEEGVEEIIANVGSFVIDRVANNKFDPAEYNKLIQSSIDAFVLGAASGGVVSGIAARASRVKLTPEQEQSIKRYKEVADNENFSKEIRESAANKIKDIRDSNAGATYDNYRLISDIENVNKRAEVINTLNEIRSEEDSQRELHDESLIAASNVIIEEKKAKVDAIMKENIDAIYSRSSAAVKEQQKLSREKAANYLTENNYYLGFTENNQDLLDRIQAGELVDINDVNKATSSLYDLEASVIADDQLTNQERNYVLQDVYSRLDSLESYDKITKNGKLLTEADATPNRTTNSELRAERSKKVRNNRFEGELFKFKTEDGRNISLRASVDENGDVTMAPVRKSFTYKTESENKSNEPFKIKGTLEVGEIKRNEDGKLISATITDTKGKKTFNTNNDELVSYLQAVQARQSLVKASNEGYSVSEDIESVQGNEVLGKLTPNQKSRFVNYYKALKSFSPNAQIILYDSEKKMAKGLVAQGFTAKRAREVSKGAMGLQHNGVIHVNISVADDATVPHEIFHEAVRSIAKTDPAAFVDMVKNLKGMLSKAELDYLQNFSNLYKNKGENLVAEEFLSELLGVLTAKRLSFSKVNEAGERIVVEVDFALNRSIGQKFILGLRELVKKYAAKINNKLLIELADKVGATTNSTEELAKFFESFAQSLREGTDVNLNYLNKFTSESVSISEDEISQKIESDQTYDAGMAIPFPTSIDYTPLDEINQKRIGEYEFPKTIPMLETVSHPIMSLNDVVEKYNGRVVIITSDATGYGVDSKGEPIFGGFGFSLNAQNVQDGIGFASLNVSTVKSTYTSAFNSYGKGKVAVLIMIQNPSTAINNAYGAKYLFRGLSEIANSNEEDLIKSKEAIANFINTSTSVSKVAKTKTERQQIINVFNKVTPNMTDKQLSALQEEYIDNTTFDSRKTIGLGIIPKNGTTKTDVGTTYSKIAFNKVDYSIYNFLKEYGDNTILTDNLINNNKGGYVVGGFELDVLPEGIERDDQIEALQSKGIVHDMFNAKLAGTNHFILDGLYGVNENFAKFAEPESEIDPNKLTEAERDQMVREIYTEDKFYEKESRDKSFETRTYSDLKGATKSKFKKEYLAPKGFLRPKAPNVATNVAKGIGFTPTEAAKSEIAKANYKMMLASKEKISKKIATDKAALMDIDLLYSARKSMEARKNESFFKWFNKDFLNSKYLRLYKQWFERNVNIRKELDKAKMVYAMQMMYNKAGAAQFAQLKFGKYRKEIYGGLDKGGVAIVDSVTQLRRVIAIDTNFDNQRNALLEQADTVKQQIEDENAIITNPESTSEEKAIANESINSLKNNLAKLMRKAKTKERPLHGKHNDVNDKKKKIASNKESAEASLAKLEKKIGVDAYAEYNKRADLYFKAFSDLLKYKLDSGLITEATYEMFKNYDYQPRNFLRFAYGQLYEDANGNMVKETPLQSNSFVNRGSMLSSDELKKISGGDMDYLDADSARLLQSALVTAEIRVSTNKALKALAEDSKLANYGFIKEAEYEKYKDGTIKLDSDGTPKFIAPTDNRFINMVYKVDGKKYAFQLKNTEETPLADEFNDIEMRDLKGEQYKFWSKWLGAGIMKTFATGINVAFPITNIPIDVISQIHLTDIYEGTIAERYQQAMMGTLEMAKRLTAAEFNLGNNSEISNLIYEFAETGGLMMSLTREYSPQMEGNWGKIVDGLGTFGNISELASKLNAYQTVKDRLVDQYYEKNGFEAREEDLEKIKTEAAYKSRAAMDYHRGGTSSKWLDGFAPYFNVMMQVSKISASYISNNKVEFGKKIGGAGLFVMAVTMYNMMVAAGDYDNDDVQRDIINNLVIFNTYKNADGTRGYTKVAVPPTVKWFLNRFQHIAEGVYLKEVLQDPKRIEKWQERTSIWTETSNMFAPRFGSILPPVAKGMIEYGFNYDIWRSKQIVEQDKNRKTSPFLEGVKNKNVAEFWKAIAATDFVKGVGLSPAKAQKFADDIFPLTNPLISMGYSLIDKSVNQFTEMPESYRSKFNKENAWTSVPSSIGDAIKDRFKGTTNPDIRFDNPEYAKIKMGESDKLFMMHDKIKSMVDDGASLREIRVYAKTQGREYVQGIQNYAMNLKKKDKIQYKIYEPDYFAMAFAPDARAKAEIMVEFEKTNEIPNMELYRKDLRRFGILNSNVRKIYEELKSKEK